MSQNDGKVRVDLSVMNEIYRITKMAMDAKDDSDGKDHLIFAAESEVEELLTDANDVFKDAMGGATWFGRVSVISSSLAGVGIKQLSKQVDLPDLDGIEEEYSKAFFAGTRLASQVGLVIGLALGLKAAGVWDEYKKHLHKGEDSDGRKED